MVVNNLSTEDIKINEHLMTLPSRLDAILIFFCTKGTMKLMYDLEEVTLYEGMSFSVRPGAIVQFLDVEDYEGASILADTKLMDSLNLSVQKLIPHLGNLEKIRGFRLDKPQMNYILDILKLMEITFRNNPRVPYYDEAVRTLISSFFYTLLSIAATAVDEMVIAEGHKKGRNEEYFRTFIRLVKENYRQERKITYYASRMNITPKYLSTLIRQFSGRGPSEWIDLSVIMEAKNLLRYSEMNIQEVAYYLGFPTQSFFGRYFKSHTGLSPKAFRNQGQ